MQDLEQRWASVGDSDGDWLGAQLLAATEPADGGALPYKATSPVQSLSKGLISTRRDVRAETRDSHHMGDPAPRMLEEAGLGLIICPGLTLVAIANSEEFSRAIAVLRKRLTSPLDKGVVVMPKHAQLKASPQDIRQIAHAGLTFVVSTQDDVRTGAAEYASEYMSRLEETTRGMRVFMIDAAEAQSSDSFLDP